MTRCRRADGLSLLLFTAGCYEIPCPPWGDPAVTVHLESATDGSEILGALGEVRDGQYRDSLISGNNDGWYSAAEDRPGTYTVHVESPGYSTWDTTGVYSAEGGGSCTAVITRIIEVRLEPAY